MLVSCSRSVLLLASGCAALLAQRSARWCTGCRRRRRGRGAALLGVVPSRARAARRDRPSRCACRGTCRSARSSSSSDALSAFFLLPIFVLSALAAVYGSEYLRALSRDAVGSDRRGSSSTCSSPAWCWWSWRATRVLFLVAWEVMSLASFFLVTFEDEKDERARGGLDLPRRHAPRHGLPAGAVRPARARQPGRSTSTGSASAPAAGGPAVRAGA